MNTKKRKFFAHSKEIRLRAHLKILLCSMKSYRGKMRLNQRDDICVQGRRTR